MTKRSPARPCCVAQAQHRALLPAPPPPAPFFAKCPQDENSEGSPGIGFPLKTTCAAFSSDGADLSVQWNICKTRCHSYIHRRRDRGEHISHALLACPQDSSCPFCAGLSGRQGPCHSDAHALVGKPTCRPARDQAPTGMNRVCRGRRPAGLATGRGAQLRTGHLKRSVCIKEAAVGISGESVLGRGQSKYKGPGAGDGSWQEQKGPVSEALELGKPGEAGIPAGLRGPDRGRVFGAGRLGRWGRQGCAGARHGEGVRSRVQTLHSVV